MEFPISLPKMAWLPQNKKQTYLLNSRSQMWPSDLTMTLTWIFKVKYGICYISTKRGLIATKQKVNILIELQASNVTNYLTLAMTLTFEFSRSNVILTIWWPSSGIRISQIVTGVTSDDWKSTCTFLPFFCSPENNHVHVSVSEILCELWTVEGSLRDFAFHFWVSIEAAQNRT